MSAETLRSTLAAWVRNPRELALANAGWILAVALPLPLLRVLPEGWLRDAALILLAAWAWVCGAWLCALVGAIVDRDLTPLRSSARWLAAHWRERLALFGLGALALTWWGLVVRFYLTATFAPWLTWPLLGLLGGLGLWLLMALLLSQGVASEGGRTWKDVWRASALLPLGYLPEAFAALALLVFCSGALVLVVGLKHWSAPGLLAPLLLAPFFTAAFYAVYLVLLSRSLFDRALGQPRPPAPGWREIWNPWR